MTKKLLSILLAVLMVMTYVTPAMALPLDMNPLEDVVEGGEAAEPVDKVEEPIDEVDAIAPGADIQAKPSKLSASVVQRMKIQANAVSGTKTGSCTPSQGAKLLSYTIGDVVGSDEEGWTTTVTFHFQSGDKFEASAANTFSGLSTFKGCEGNWVYYFNETHPADQTITLYRDGKAWAYYNYFGTLTKIKSSGNINIGHLIQVDMRLDTELPKSYTVTYTDGVDGEEIFADQTYTVEENKATPAFNGEPTREGYEFAGWQPEVAATVTADVTYTAQWKVESNNVARLESDGSEYTTIAAAIKAANNAATMTEGHPAQTVTILKDTTESVNYSWVTAASVKWDFNLTIDLNGKTVTGNSGSVFTFTRNCADKSATSAFYVTFTDSVGTGVVTGGNNPNGKGGAINAISKNGHAKLTINGGTYKGNTAQKGGAIATYENSTDYGFDVEINGGLITENTASDIGGGIYAYNAISRVVVNGGEIIGNTATNAGDDIAFASKNSLGSKYESLLKLQNSSWYHDKSGSRYSASNAVAFKQWNGYTTQGKNNMVYLKYVEPTYVYVTYEDGLNNTVFAKEEYKVVAGSATPAFTGSTERAGYKFVGWQPALAEKATEDVTYVAQWELLPTYKLTFNGNGTNKLSGTISGSHTSKTRYTEGTNVNLNTAMDGKKFTKELSADYSTNYRQTGWNTKADGTGDHYAMNGTFVMPAYDVTLYAEWESYEWIHWNVQMSEGGDHINYTTKYMGPKADVQSFKAYTGNVGTSYGKVPAAYYTPVKAVAKEGYRFIGWYDVAKNECISTNDTLYGKDFEALRALTLAESGAVLEARFEAKKASNIHVVIYKASDLTKPVVSKAVTNLYDGDTFTPNIADYYSSANGYEFVGWFNDGNFNQYKAGKNYTEATEFTVTGAWQNVIAVVTDYEKVVVKAVYDGDKANAKTVYSGLALRGTNVIEYLEANAGVGEVEGYTLDKWYNWDWYGHKVAENATVNGWTNVYVTYTRNIFTVTYTDGVNGAAFADESHTAKYEDATPAFEGSLENYIGWVFNGWNPKVADKVTEDVTYTAKWRMKGANTVIYYGNEGVRSNGDTFWSEYTNAQTKVLGSNTGYYEFTRTGWHFTGWNTKADGTGDAYAAGATYTFTAAHNLETVELYAQWERNTYTVKYVDGVNGAAFADESHTAKYEDATPAFEGSLENYIGWVFNGWNPKVADKVTEDVTYTAKWRMKGANTVIYYGNEGVRSNGDTFWSEYTNAQTKVLGSNTGYYEFTRTGWHFTGWNTKADGTGDAYAAGATYTFTAAHNLETVKLYAQWEANTYTVSFNCNGGEACAPITVTYGEAYGRQLPACFVDGMQNLGWYLVDMEGNVTDTSIGERTLVTEARDHQLFQKREIMKPTVKLNLSRPVYNYLEKPVTIQSSGITEYPALKYSYQWYKDGTALTDGKIYEGSNTANLTLKHDYVSCSGLYKLVVTISVADNSGIVSANGTVTAEAKYDLLIRRSSNMVIYDANGGQGGPLNDSDYYDKANDRYIAKLRGVDAIPNSPLVRQGYHFLGWNTKADGTGDSYKPGDFYVFDRELSENGGLRVTLYAMWEACADHLIDVKVLKAPTCTEKGLKLCRCKVCGVEYEVEMPALGHDLSGWIWNRTEHWKKCRRCGELLEVDKHTLTEWKDILRNGEIVPEHHCVVCGFSECGSVIHIDGTKKPQAGVEVNPPTGAEVPSLLPALAVLAGAAVLLRKKK